MATPLENRFLHIILVFFILTSCQKPENRSCWKSIGDETSETRDLQAFSTLVIKDNIEVELIPDEQQEAEVTSGKNLLNFITTEVRNDTLFVMNENQCNNLRSREHFSKVKLHFSKIDKIIFEGLNDLFTQDTILADSLVLEAFNSHGNIDILFKGDYFSTIMQSGTSEVTAKGEVRRAYMYQISYGSTDYSQLKATEGLVHSRTVGDCFVNISNNFKVEIHGNGSVYYKNYPQLHIELKKRGTGKLLAQ